MKRFLTGIAFVFLLVTSNSALAQCDRPSGNAPNGLPYYYGQIDPSCGSFTIVNNYSPGRYFQTSVLEGGSYTFSTCGSSIDTELSFYENNNTTNEFAYNNNSGPDCSGLQASATIVPTFTHFTRVHVTQNSCLTGGTSSVTVKVRQNNNLSISGLPTELCQGEQATAYSGVPARVAGVVQFGSGDRGTFTGTGVSGTGGTTFTAPTPSGASQTYTLTYTFGYCSTTQNVTVYANPTTASAGPDQLICTATTTLAANAPTIGTGQWFVVSGTASVANPSSPTSSVTLTTSTATLRWTISNGTCTPSTSEVIITKDGTNPTITCPSTITVNAPTGQCAKVVGPADGYVVTASDACTPVNVQLTSGLDINGSFPVGTSTETWSATDPSGNTASCSFNVVVVDNQLPTITCPVDISVNNDAGSCFAVVNYNATTNDNCPGELVTVIGGLASGAQFPIATTTVTLRVDDAVSPTPNTASCSFTVTVEDNEAPQISCPGNISVNNEAGQCHAAVSWTEPVGTDNCTGSITNRTGLAPGSDFPVGITTVTYIVTDAATTPSSTSCSFTVEVIDNELPVVTCPTAPTVNAAQGQCGLNYSYTIPYSDNCSATISQVQGLSSGGFFSVGDHDMEFNISDPSGNTVNCAYTLTVVDNQYPTFPFCPGNTADTIFFSTGTGVCSALASYNVLASDNCTGGLVTTHTPAQLDNGSTFDLGSTDMVYTATDASGNTATCEFVVTVKDEEFPFISCPANQSVTFPNCQYTLPDYLALGTIDTSDNCTPVLFMAQNPAGGTIVSAQTTVEMSATDNSGNVSTCAFTITPLDNVPPTIGGCPALGEVDSVEVNSSCQFLIPDYALILTASDDCNPSPTVSQSPPAGTTSATATTIIVSVSDGSNTTTCTFDAVPKDATPPTITCPADRVEPVGPSCQFDLPDYTTLPAVTTSDNCGGTPVRSQPSAGTTISGTTTVILYAEDASGNIGSCSFEVSLQDNIDPTINCPASHDVYVNANCLYSVESLVSLATTGDNCSGPVVVTQNPSVGTAVSGTPSLELTATDVAGNTSTCNISLSLLDTIAPNVGCPQPQTVDVDGSCEYAMGSFTSLATATDACSAVTITQSPVSGSSTFNFTTDPTVEVTIYATDADLNVDSCTFQVLLRDVTGPTITCGNNITNVIFDQNCEAQVGNRTANYVGSLSSLDNCDAAPVITQSPSSTTVIQGQTTVTLTATDASGNTGSCTFDIIPTDGQAPSITCPQAAVPIDLDANCNYTLGDYTGLTTYSDNCDLSLTIAQTPGVGTVVTSGTSSTVTVRATDDAGNFNVCTITVTPQDNTPPSITCPADQTESFNASCEFVMVSYIGLATATDNCDPSVSITQSPSAGGQPVTGSTAVILTASDGTNTSSCTFNVIPDDTTPPTITCPADQDVSFNATCQYNILNYTGLATGVADNCGSNPGDVVITQSLTSGSAIGDTATITLTATDPSGNTTTCTFDVNPSDNTAPSIGCPQNQTVNVDASCEYSIIDYTGQAVSNDACGSVDVTQSPTPAGGFALATVTTVTLTGTDGSGNQSTCTFTVSGIDNLAPSISCPTDTVVTGNANCQFVMLDETSNHELIVVDNCGGSPTVSQSPAAGTTIIGFTVVTLTAEDAVGNSANCTFSYTVDDQTNPTIACPADMEVSSNPSCDFVVPDFSIAGTVDDNCDANPTVTQDPLVNQVFVDDTLVTLTVTDASGNLSTCTFTISESTDELPNITCPGDQLVDFDINCEYDLIDFTSLAVATDNCGTPSVAQTQTPGTTVTGTTTIELVATDVSLNTVSCTFDVIPSDNSAPTVSCLQPSITPATSAQCTFTVADYTTAAFVSATDNCTLPALLTTTQSPVVGSLIGSTTAITISTTDAAGNVGTCSMTVTPEDQANPILFCPANATVSLDANCEFDLPDYTPLVFVSDNCDSAPFIITQSPASGQTITGEDVTTVSFSVTDGNSNVGTCSITVTTEDNDAPTITCPSDDVVSANASCEFTLQDYTGDVTVDDNCSSSPVLVQSPASGDYSGNVLVTMTATDDAGNTNSCSFNVAAEDDTAPSLTCPSNQTPNFTSNCEFSLVDYTSLSTYSDFCDNSLFVTQSPGFGAIISGTTTVTITALDDAGNDSICTFQVTPVDIEVPTVTCPADFTVSVDANCNYDIVDYRSMVVATDNCSDPVQLFQNPSTGSLSGGGTSTLITITALDDVPNSSTCTFSITLVDDTDPVLTNCPTDHNVNLNANCQFVVADYTVAPLTATDACGGNITVGQSPLAGSLIGGVTTVSVTATDASGNTDVCSFVVTPLDVTNPNILACPADISVNNDPNICGAVISYPSVTAIDNCDGVVVPQLTPAIGQPSGTVFPVGVTPVQYEATDNAGNSSFCDFNVTVIDTEDPVIVCPADVTENAQASTCEAAVTYQLPTVSDNCNYGLDSALITGFYPNANFPVGTTLVTWEAYDAALNTSSCSFNVTVLDAEPPVITCPADMVVSNDPGMCDAVVTYSVPTVTDNCTSGIIPNLTGGLASGGTFSFGVNTISYQAEDSSGNTDDCSFTITVEDNEPPVLTCPNDTSVTCDAAVAYNIPTVTDNCNSSIVPVQTAPTVGSPFPFGPTTVTFTGDDGNGNSATCDFVVTVIDTVAPSVTCPSDQMETFDAQCQMAALDYTSLGSATDVCDGAPVLTQSPASGTTITGSAIITLTATDFAGNSSTCAFSVIDDTPPVVSCPVNQVVGSDINCQFTLLDYTTLVTTTDNCGASGLVQAPASGTVVSANTTVVMTATDDFGNTSTCQFDIELEDNIQPSITCLGNQVGVFDANCEYQLPDYAVLAATDDNCDASPVITQVPLAGETVQGDTVITLTATDTDGNNISCSFNLSPDDNVSPAISCPSSQQALFDASCSFLMVDYTGLAGVTDNCSSVFTVTQSPAVGSAHSANTLVTLTAQDQAGNSSNCVFIVVPEDQIAPTITCPSNQDVAVNANCEFNLADYTGGATSSDNCSNSVVVTQTPAIGSNVSSLVTVTLTANDGNGNTASCDFDLTPEDMTPPEVECAADIQVNFNNNCEFEISDYIGFITATDNCSGITYSQTPAAGSIITGTGSVTLTATDVAGNSAACSFGILPNDSEPPSITCPTDQNVDFNAACGYPLLDYVALASASDNCQLSSLSQSISVGTVITAQTTIVLTATDNAGNTATCSLEVIPVDVTNPVISCPQDLEVDFDNGCQFFLDDYSSLVQIADNCLNTLFIQTPAFGTAISGQTTLVMSVEDEAGNTASCSFEVIPTDNSLPTITCPQNLTVDLDNNCQFEIPDYRSQAITEDNCSSVGLLVGQFPPLGTIINSNTVVTLTVEDDNGNEADCSFALEAQDTVAPVITTCPADLALTINGNCETVVSDFTLQVVATDNCDGVVVISQIPAVGTSLIGAGSNLITMVATDDSGNSVTCEFNAIVTDDVNPAVTCPVDQVLQLSSSCQFVLPDYTLQSSGTDACGTVTLTQSPAAGSPITSQLNATIIAEDESGNTATCTFFVTPQPMEVTVTGIDATCNSGSNGSATVSVTGGTPPYTEDWGGFDPTALAGGNYAVIVSDANGCPATGSVTIADGPLFNLEITPNGTVYVCEGESVLLDAGAGYAVYDWSTGASVASINVSNQASYWVQVADANGCWSNTDTATVVFFDELAPQIISLPNGLLESSNDSSQSYQWYFNGSPINGATNFSYCPLVSGNYVVAIIDANGCEVESNFAEITVNADAPCLVGIDEYGLSLDVYPNPSTGIYTVKYALQYQMDVELAVFDLVGTRVSDDVLISSQSGTTVIDLSQEAEGVYLLRITLGNDKVLQQRLVLVK